jgi:hypothetical protein
MRYTHTKLLSGATTWFALGFVLAMRALASGQDIPQPPSAGQESSPRAPVLGIPGVPERAGFVGPAVEVEHKGRLLVLTYGPRPGAGGLLSNAGPPGEPPGFTVYKGQQKIASGQFEYG